VLNVDPPLSGGGGRWAGKVEVEASSFGSRVGKKGTLCGVENSPPFQGKSEGGARNVGRSGGLGRCLGGGPCGV